MQVLWVILHVGGTTLNYDSGFYVGSYLPYICSGMLANVARQHICEQRLSEKHTTKLNLYTYI